MKKFSFLTICGATLGLLACSSGGGGSGSGSASASNISSGESSSNTNNSSSGSSASAVKKIVLILGGGDSTVEVQLKEATSSYESINLPPAKVYAYASQGKNLAEKLTPDSTFAKVDGKIPFYMGWKLDSITNGVMKFQVLFQDTTKDATQFAFLQMDKSNLGVYSVADLAAINSNSATLSGKYLQLKDLDLDLLKNQKGAGFDASGWIPLGKNGNAFLGNYNGNGKTISNLTINRGTNDHSVEGKNSDDQGLFGYSSGNLTKVALLDASITGRDSVGALVGYQLTGSIIQSYSTGKITGSNNVGGLMGEQNGGSIEKSYSTGVITGKYDYVGGLLGKQWGIISQSYASGSVTGNNAVGGLVGWQEKGSINQAYATGKVAGTAKDVGGLVGFQSNGFISQAYALGDVTGSSEVGTLVGIKRIGTLANSFYLAKPNLEAVNGNATDGATKITSANSKSASQFDVLVKDASGVDSGIWMKDGTNWPIFKGWDAVFGKDPQLKNTLP